MRVKLPGGSYVRLITSIARNTMNGYDFRGPDPDNGIRRPKSTADLEPGSLCLTRVENHIRHHIKHFVWILVPEAEDKGTWWNLYTTEGSVHVASTLIGAQILQQVQLPPNRRLLAFLHEKLRLIEPAAVSLNQREHAELVKLRNIFNRVRVGTPTASPTEIRKAFDEWVGHMAAACRMPESQILNLLGAGLSEVPDTIEAPSPYKHLRGLVFEGDIPNLG